MQHVVELARAWHNGGNIKHIFARPWEYTKLFNDTARSALRDAALEAGFPVVADKHFHSYHGIGLVVSDLLVIPNTVGVLTWWEMQEKGDCPTKTSNEKDRQKWMANYS